MLENLTDHLPEKEKKDKVRQRLWKVRAKKVILATGSIERPMIFDSNDRPGIMLSSAIKKYVNFYSVKCGNKIVIFTNNDSAYETAIDLYNKGSKVEAIIDIRENSSGDLPKKCSELGLKIYWKHTIVSSNGQEDHVSMGANSATKLYKVVENTERFLAIELLNATQGLAFRNKKSSDFIENILDNSLRRTLPN